MLDNKNEALIGMAGGKDIFILPEMLNRHGLITGATGTGKTVSLQTLAESFSELGIPVFMADVKGDLSGIAKEGRQDGKVGKRVEELELCGKGWKAQAFPVCFWDVFGKSGHHLRATISDLGPTLLARLLNLNDVQAGVLQIIFKIADDNGLLLLDLKDLVSMTQYVGEEREQFRVKYGQISPASIGAIQRALLRLQEEGGENFFGEPALDIMDLMQTDHGKGVINILAATDLINAPSLYSCVLLYLLSELYERLPEAGDLRKPRLIFFFDEAHLLFKDISPVLLQKIEQIVRLIRSRGVGIFFVSQNPSDMPDSILGQLGNRVQHALRAFTPRDQKAVRAAAQAFRPNPAFSTEEAIGELKVGEALISFLDENGAPAIVERALVVPPEGQVGPISPEERQERMNNSPVGGSYDKTLDRESAYEILTGRARDLQMEKEEQERGKEEEKQRKQREKEEKERLRQEEKASKQGEYGHGRMHAPNKRPPKIEDPFGNLVDTAIKRATATLSNTVGREMGKAIIRGLLGSLAGKK